MITWPELADAVRRCAAHPATAVHVAGRPGGVLRLRAGAMVGTWTSGTPLAVSSPEPVNPSRPAGPISAAGPLARLAITDAVFVIAAGRVTAWRAEDDSDAAGDEAGMALEVVIAEVDRRLRRVSGPDGPLSPDETVVRRLPWPPVRLSPTPDERLLLETLGPGRDGVRTVRDLAFALGRGVFGVLLDVQRLAGMGAVALTRYSPVERRPAPGVQTRRPPEVPPVTAASAPRRRPVPMTESHPVPAVLAQRVPGATAAAMGQRRAEWHPHRLPGQPPDGQPEGRP